MMAVNLGSFAGTLQYPAVADHGAARALCAAAALLPVVQHQPVCSGVEEGQRVGNSWKHSRVTVNESRQSRPSPFPADFLSH